MEEEPLDRQATASDITEMLQASENYTAMWHSGLRGWVRTVNV
jgi:hypothetical protein